MSTSSLRLLCLSLVCSFAGLAHADARLGKFTGLSSSQNSAQVGQGPRKDFSGSGNIENVCFKLRRDRNRLYVSIAARPQDNMGEWRQSLELMSESKLADGTRVIDYRRPGAGSRMAKYNLRAHNSAMPEGGLEMKEMAGGGRLELKPDGTMLWRNQGAGKLELPSHPALQAHFEWTEDFAGKHAR